MLKPGDRVICIEDKNPDQGPPPHVVKGHEYTITKVMTQPYGMRQTDDGIIIYVGEFVLVAELPAPHGIGWFSFRFRKIEERKTDISVFTDILNKVKAPEKV